MTTHTLQSTNNPIITVEQQKPSVFVKSTIKKETLADLIAQMTSDNMYPPVDWGDPVGKEIW
jgi:antitoxin component of MazEF toxin-antitoxin module